MGLSNGILTAPFTKIGSNGDLQQALDRAVTSHIQLIGDVDQNGVALDPSKINKWARYKPVPINSALPSAYDPSSPYFHNGKTSAHNVNIPDYSNGSRVLENAVGTILEQSVANDSPLIYFWDMYGIRVPVLRGTNGANPSTIATAIDYIVAHPELNLSWPRFGYTDWPSTHKFLRALDFDGYAKRDLVDNPFEYTIGNGYSDEGPMIYFQYDNGEYAGYRINLTNILDVLGGIGNWKICVIIKSPTNSYTAIEKAIERGAYSESWISEVISTSATTSGYKAYFCARDTSHNATILLPGTTDFPNPATFTVYNSTNPAKNPFLSGLGIDWDSASLLERYTQLTGQSVSIKDITLDNTHLGILSNGYMAFRFEFKNTANTSKTFNVNNITFHFGFRGETYPFESLYQGTSTSPTSTREFTVASGSSIVLTFEFNGVLRSTDGLISSNAVNGQTGLVDIRYNGTAFDYFEICYRYSTNNMGSTFDWSL